MRLLPYGDRGVLVECDDGVDPVAMRAALLAGALPGVLAAVPAARTVLVEIDPARTSIEQLDAHLAGVGDAGTGSGGSHGADLVAPDEPTVEITVRYDGPDLAAVASELAIDVDTLVDRHARTRYRVAFCGFAPGFAYLTGLDPALHVPRLAEPRTSVPVGSVAIAGEFTAVYPRPSPGGWRLLGSTGAELWQVDREPPALLRPGMTVRFVPS